MTGAVLAGSGLPDSVTTTGAVAVIAVMGAVTFVLRFLPFQAARVFRSSGFFGMLGTTMPVGVLTVLVVFTIGSLGGAPGRWMAVAVAMVVTVAAQLVTRKPGISIVAGTAVYMVLVNAVL